MSFLGDAIGATLGGVGVGLPLAHFWGDLNKKNSPTPYKKAPIQNASDVGLIDELRDPLKAINQKRQVTLKDFLGGISSRQTTSNKASGRVLGEYAPAELTRAGGVASRGIENTLLGQLGGASVDERKKQQEHEANLAIAQEIGALMKPSVLEQILSGLSGGGKAGAQFYGLYNALGKSGGGSGPGYSSNPSYGLSSAKRYGLDYPNTPDFGTPRRDSYAF